VAWKLLAGRRLFRGNSDADTMWNVVHGEIPDIALNSRAPVPHEVAGIIMACLNRNPHDRPSSAARISEVFHSAALAEGGGAQALGEFMAAAFAADKSREESALSQAMADPFAVSQDSVMKALDYQDQGGSGRSENLHGQVGFPTGSAKKKKGGAPTWLVVTTLAFALAAMGGVGFRLYQQGVIGGPGETEAVAAAAQTPEAAAAAAAEIRKAAKEKAEQNAATEAAAAKEAAASPTAAKEAAAAAAVAAAAKEAAAKEAAAKEAAAKEAAAKEAATQKITLRVGAGVRLALVDGTRHDERPLSIELGDQGKAEVTLLTHQGVEKSWTIGVGDDGRALDVPSKPIAGAKKRPLKKKPVFKKKKPIKKKKPVKKKTGDLIEVPL
jgi:hypothetical protein